MIRIEDSVWSKLRGDQLEGQMLWARRAVPDISSRLLAGLDADHRRHLLIALESLEEGVDDSQSRGVSVVTRELSGLGHDPGRYIDLVCLDGSGHGAFDVIGGEIAERMAGGTETAAECVVRVLGKWRRFWGQAPRALLSREEQIGLVAELWFLLFWLIPLRGTSSTSTWRGPFGSRHDFEWQERSVEVKGTTSTRALIHRISSLSQLSLPDQGDLLLFSLRLREEGGGRNTLPGLVNVGRNLLQPDPAALEHFELALLSSGYSPAHDEEYQRIRWRVVEELLFRVDDDFPRLTDDSFAGGLPTGVERITYEINLSGVLHLCVARSPGNGFAL